MHSRRALRSAQHNRRIAMGSSGPVTTWLVRNGSIIQENPTGKTWRGAGANWYWAGLRQSNLQYPSHAMIDTVIDELVAMGANVVKAHTLGISAGKSMQLVTAVNSDASLVWNETAWETIDYVVQQCKKKGLRLWIPFTSQQHEYYGSKQWWVQQAFVHQAYSDIPSDYYYADPSTGNEVSVTGITSFDPASGTVETDPLYRTISQEFYSNWWIEEAWLYNYVGGWMDHVNQYTGVANSDEPTISFVQAGDEMNDTGEQYATDVGVDGAMWAQNFSSAVKWLSPHALVVDPMGSMTVDGINAPGAYDPYTDILDFHLYTADNTYPPEYALWFTTQAKELNKACAISEYVFDRPGVNTVLNEVESQANAVMTLFWAVYTTTETHVSTGPNDSIYIVGQNQAWKTRFAQHAGIMRSGTVTTISTGGKVNLLRSAAVANCNSLISRYGVGSSDGIDPELSLDPEMGYFSSPALSITIDGSGAKWVYPQNQSDWAPVTPGQQYTGAVYAKLSVDPGTLGSGGKNGIVWYDAAGVVMYVSMPATGQLLSTDYFTMVTCTDIAPPNAAYASLQFGIDGPTDDASATLLIDRFGIFSGSSATPWVQPMDGITGQPFNPANKMLSAVVADCKGSTSYYGVASSDSIDPTLAIISGQGRAGRSALSVSMTGIGRKSVWPLLQDSWAPVIPGSSYYAAASIRLVSGAPSSGVFLRINWYDAFGEVVAGESMSNGDPISAGNFTTVSVYAEAPKNAVFAVPQVDIDGPSSGSATILIDEFAILKQRTGTTFDTQINMLASTTFAHASGPTSLYLASATDGVMPSLSIDATGGVNGTSALVLTSTGPGTKSIEPASDLAYTMVDEIDLYTASASVRLGSGSAGLATVSIIWYDFDYAVLDTVTSTGIAITTADYTQLTVTAMAPANTAYASVRCNVAGSSSGSMEVLIDQFGIFKGMSAVPWGPPPVVDLYMSAEIAQCEATIDNYTPGSVDGNNPVLSTDETGGVGASPALIATVTGNSRKWIYPDTFYAGFVTPNTVYTGSVSAKLLSGSLPSGIYAHISWYDEDDTYLGGINSSAVATTIDGDFVEAKVTATAPSNAYYAISQIEFDGPSSGTTVVAIDDFGLFEGPITEKESWRPAQ